MSSLDRAFFRAYAKEQPPVEAPAGKAGSATENASPYVHFQSSRHPQLRYRIEPTHAPWGQAAVSPPHVDTASIAIEADDAVYGLEPPVEEPTAWSYQPVVPLQRVDQPKILPAPTLRRAVAPQQRLGDEIVCLPGVRIPESNYVATPDEATPAATSGVVVQVTTVAAADSALVESKPAENKPDAGLPVQETPAVATPVAEPIVEANATSLLGDDTTAFWEVDRFLYPEMSDRLLQQYAYFQQAGEKLKQASAAGLKVLAITGIGRDEGRSTLAICLARAAAKSGLRVGLVDCDFERPQLAQQLGLDASAGWQSVATGKIALAEAAIRSVEEGITLLPLTDDAATGSLTTADERVSRVIAQAASSLDVVVLDIGPLDPSLVAQTSGSIKKVPFDAAIVVWDRRCRQLEQAQAIARQLSAAGVEAVGIAENFAKNACT